METSLRENLEIWEIVCPQGAKLIREMEEPGLANDFFFHLEIDPISEVEESFHKLSLKNTQVLYVYGLGGGNFYEAANDWLKESSDHYLVFLEDDPQVIRHFFRRESSSEILKCPKVFLYFIGGDPERIPAIGALTFNFADLKFEVTGLPSYLKLKSNVFDEIIKAIAFFDVIHKSWKIDSVAIPGVLFFKNYVPNFLKLPGSYFGEELKGKFKGIPAIICGAGPSLDKNIDVLSTLTDKAIIFAGGTALNAVNAKGVMPHFGAGIDPNFEQYTRLIMNHAYHIPFIYRMRMLPNALNMVHGDKLFITSGCIHQGACWIEKQLEISGMDIPDGFNVLNFLTSLANMMGCYPIICVGIDLAYSGGNSYASGIQSHALHDRNDHFRTKDKDEELVEKPDIYGNPVYTLWKWIAESAWYSSFASNSTNKDELLLINATEGGIGFSGVENLTLRQVQDRFLTKTYDLESLIHGEIQNSPLPKTCNSVNMREIFSKMLEALRESEEALLKIAELYEAFSKTGDEEEKVQAEELAKKLKESDLFLGFLKDFYDSITLSKSLRIKEIKRSSGRSSELQEKAFAALECEKYLYLKNTAAFGKDSLKMLLMEKTQEEKPVVNMPGSIGHRESSEQQLSYIFNEHEFKIIDPEIGIHYAEKLPPILPLSKDTLYYPSGKLKMESSYKMGVLHGPQVFYSENQIILSKAWYIDGKREGRVIRYFQNGALYSTQAYRNGLKVGVHQYYYENGNLRMVLAFSAGLLNGEVVLFYENGKVFRILSFVNDKREGKEEIWDSKGALSSESFYQNGEPSGTTREWHKNGALAKEILYGEDRLSPTIKLWDQNGVPINPSKPRDYFNEMAETTSVIANSLEDVADKLSKVVKSYGSMLEEGDRKADIRTSLAGSLKDIEEKMELFKSAALLLKTQNESDLRDSKEAIWKSPETKELISQEIDKMSELMGREMKSIEEGMKKIMNELNKNKKINDSKIDN